MGMSSAGQDRLPPGTQPQADQRHQQQGQAEHQEGAGGADGGDQTAGLAGMFR